MKSRNRQILAPSIVFLIALAGCIEGGPIADGEAGQQGNHSLATAAGPDGHDGMDDGGTGPGADGGTDGGDDGGDAGQGGGEDEARPWGNHSHTVSGLVWLNHYDLLPGGDEVTTTYRSTSSGVGGGLTALVVNSSTTGDTFQDGGNKVVHMAASGLPPGSVVTGARVCYQLTDPGSFITQVRLAQVADPPASALIRLDDAADLTDVGPVCTNTTATSIQSSDGPILASLRLDFGSTEDVIAIRGFGLYVEQALD